MFKPLTFSLSLALALGLSGVSKAGGLIHGHGADVGCATCGIASPQGPMVSPQAPLASPQYVDCGDPGCVGECGAKKCNLLSGFGGLCDKMKGHMSGLGCGLKDGLHGMGCGLKDGMSGLGCGLKDICSKLKPKPPVYTYEWVLKKKRVWGHHDPCGSASCDTCGVYPTGQSVPAPSGQGHYAAPQGGYVSPQAGYSSPQASYGSGQANYGSGQIAVAPVGDSISAPVGDEAPPAPAAPVPPAPSVPGVTTGLLFSTPTGN